MGAGSSAEEQRSPSQEEAAHQGSQPSSPEGQPGTQEAAAAQTEQQQQQQPEEPAKLLQKNGQISSINGITEEQVDLSLKPEELNGQQAEVIITDVGQRETASVILKEESVENMEAKPPESTNKTNGDDDQKDVQDADKQSPSLEEKGEEQEQPSESPSNDVGFKKVFKLVGFKFTVRKDKTEKVEPVQLLNVKADDTEVASDGSGDHKEIKKETVEEATQIEVPHSLAKTEQETQTEKMKEETSLEKETESPIEAGGKDTETKNDGSKSPESPTSPLTSETASPLRKFFTQGWAGFRKRTSFRKPKEEEQQALDKEKQEQERDVTKEEGVIKEELEEEKPVPEKAQTDVEANDEKVEKNREEKEGKTMIDVSTETHQKEITVPHEQLSRQESAEGADKKIEISLNEKSDLALEEKSEPGQECLIALKQSTLESSEKKLDPAAPLENEEKIDQSDPAPLITTEEPKEHFETVDEGKSEPKAPLATESFDEKLADANTDLTISVKKDEPKTIQKEQLVLEQLTDVDTEIQRGEPTDEQLKVKETVPETMNEQLKQTEPGVLSAATTKPPEGITNEVELISSQERAKMQGSPLKKLFTSSSLKKLSVKKHKGKREEAKSGETAEQILSDSAESPEDPRAESSASSPEEATESGEKVTEGIQVTETEDGSTSDMEKKRESVTPWASFKKMVTPKKRIRRLSESDKEEEPDKGKSATLSSTESAPCEEQEDIKENGEEQKLEKNTDEPKKKVDTSVSWEALICVGSSKKRSRKSSSSDEEVGQRLAQEGQKIDETAPNKETAGEITFTSSQESDQGQGGSSPEQAGSPSEGEGVSTWESFKRLVTARRKSKTKMEERSEEPAVVPSLEYSTSDGESGKEESWVSFKKLMPGRRKKKSDGIPEHAPVQETGEEITETNEEDYDIPAVVPLSEYEAAEQEKLEAQKKNQEDITVKGSDQTTERSEGTLITEQSSEGLVHAVTVTVVEGERAVTSIEERSPSWISAAVTETVEQADEEKQTKHISETGLVEETVVATKLKPEIKKDISGDTIISELELTSEAITAREEASGVEEGPEVSCAEETTEMVSAVSRLSESPDTTEIATPVQEVDESQQNLEELSKQTQEILEEVAERVKLSEETKMISETTPEVIIQPVSVQKTDQEITVVFQGAELSESILQEKASERTDILTNEDMEHDQGQVEVKESSLKEVLEKSHDVCVEVKKSSEETTSLNQIDEDHHPKSEQEALEKPREMAEEQAIAEKSEEEEEEEEDFVIVTVTPEETPEVTIDDAAGKQLESLKEKDSEEYSKAYSVQEVKMHLEEGTQGKMKEDVQEFKKEICEETPVFPQKQEEVANVICELEAETTEVEKKKPVKQNEVNISELLTKTSCADTVVHEAPIQSKSIDVSVQDDKREVSDMSMEKDAALGLETGSTQEVTVEAGMQNKVLVEHMKTGAHIQKMDPEVQLQELETKVPLVDVKPEPLLVNLETQIHAEMVGKEISVRKMDADKETVEAEDHIQTVETSDHIEEMERKSHILSVREEVLAEKSELNVEIDLSTEKTKTESITEKADVEEHLKETEAPISSEDAHSKLSVESDVGKMEQEMAQPTTEVKSEAPKEKMEVEDHTEKLKAAATSEKEDVTVHVETATERIDAKIESEICTDKTDAKVNGESSTEKADGMVEGETVIPPMLTDENLKEDPPSARVDMEPLVEKVGAEIAKEKTEMDIVKDMGHSTEEAKAEDEKTDVEATIENAGAKADLKLFAGETLEKVCEEHSEEMMEAGTATKQPELKDTLQKVENEAIVQSVVKDTAATYLATCTEVVSAEAPVHLVSEQESVVSDMTRVAIQGESQSVATEKSITQEQQPLEVSTSRQDKVDLTQMVVADASFVLESQITEGIEAEAQEGNALKDIAVMKSNSTNESITESSVQTERVVPAVEEEKIAVSLGTTALEGSVQSEKEDALTSESKYMEVNVVEDSVQNEATGDFVKELATETESAGALINKAEVDGGILTSESGYKGSLASNAILENIRDSTPADDKEASINGFSVQIHSCPGKLLQETVHPLSVSPTASDSYQRGQTLSEKVQIIETQKSSENIELGGGDVLPAAPVEQDIFAEQQEIVTTDISEMQSYAAHKSSITGTATEAEEQVSTEKVTLTETAETPQSLLQEIKETTFQMVQQVSFVHSVPGPDTKKVSEKTNAEAEEPILPAASFTKDDLPKSGFDPIPEMKLQKSETSQEAEKQMTSPARSPSLTHIEFAKDVVQSVTIESQSTKIVLKIIQNAVDKMEETEEQVFSSQQTEPCPLHADKSEIREDLQKQEAFKTTEVLPLSTEKCENGRSSDTSKTAADLEAVKHMSQTDEQSHTLTKVVQVSGSMSEAVKEIIKEESLQKENGEPKLQTVVDTAVPTEAQRVTLESVVSGSLPKKSLEADQPKLKDVDVEQIQEQLIEQQMPVKRKEDHSPSTGFVEIQSEKDVNNQDCTSHEIPQLKSELTES